MAKVSTIANTARVSLDTLQSGIIELSNETGMAAADLSEAMYQAISASVDTADAVSFTEQAVKLARGGFTDAASAVDVMTTVLNAYGIAATEASRVSDVLIQVQNKGKTTVNELASNMGRVIPTASAYGVSLDNLGAAYARMTANGIATAETTTYVNSMLNELGKSGTDASDALKDLTGKTFKQLMEGGSTLGEVLGMLQDKAEASGLSIADMFGSAEAGKAALTLLADGVDGFNSSLADMQDSTGLTENAFETMSDTAENSAEVIKNKFKNLGIEIYNQNSDSIARLMSAVGNLADGFISFAQEAAPKVADAITWVIDNADLLSAALETAVNAVIAYHGTILAQSAISKFKIMEEAVSEYARAMSTSTNAVIANQSAGSMLLAMMTPLEIAYGVLTGRIKLAEAAQLALNAAKKASVGTISLVVAGIAGLVTALVNYVKNADTAANRTKKLKEDIAALNEEYEQAKQAAEDNADAERTQLLEAEKLIARLKELDRIMRSGTLTTDEYATAANELRTVVDKLSEIMPDLKIGIDKETGALTTQISEVKALYNAYKDLMLLKIKANVYEEQLTAAGKRVVEAEEILKNTPEVEVSYSSNAFEHMTPTYDSSAYEAASKEVAEARDEYDRIFNAMLDTQTDYVNAQAAYSQKVVDIETQADLSADSLRNEKFLANSHYSTLQDSSSSSENSTAATFKADVDAFKAAQKELERSYKLGKISEREYYKQLGVIRDKYLDETSDEWLDATVDIKKYNEQAAKDAAEATDEQIDAMFKNLEKDLKLGEISEAEYYDELGELRDTFLKESDDRWYDATLAIKEYEESLLKSAQTAAEQVLKEFDDSISDLESKQKSFASKLLATGSLIEKETKTYQFGKLPEVTVEYTTLANLDQQTKDMQAYADALAAVKERGELPDGFFSELRDMSVEDGLEYINALLRLSDEDFDAYLKAWQNQRDVANEISKEVYSDEASAIVKALEAEFGQVPEDFFDLGADSAEKYSEGFLQALPSLMQNIQAQITAGLSSIISGTLATSLASAAAGGVTYNNTYNVQPSSGESTQAQLLAIANVAAIEQQR